MSDSHSEDNSVEQFLNRLATAQIVTAHKSHNELLKSITETATAVVGAKAASLFTIDADRQELVFEVTLGTSGAKFLNTRMPLSKGIAGFSAVTGQAIAVADVSNDPRWAHDISDLADYTPQSILSVPMIARDRVVGVLELLDRDDGQPFVPDDIEMAGRFAAQAAISITLSENRRALETILHLILNTPIANDALRDFLSPTALSDAARAIKASDQFQKDIEIAERIALICNKGSLESELCLNILKGIEQFLERSRITLG